MTMNPEASLNDATWSPILRESLERVRRVSLVAGVGGLALSGLGALLSPDQFFRSYLMAYVFVVGIVLGSLAIVMVHHLAGGAWGLVIRRLLESATRTLPLMALLFVPLLFGLASLYPWARPEVMASDPVLQRKQAYLNVPFFVVRAIAYFVLWGTSRVFPEPLVARAGSSGCKLRPPLPPVERTGSADLWADGHVHGRGLGDVARPALVLDDFRRALHGRPGAVRDGVRDRRPAPAGILPALVRCHHPIALSRSRQAAAGLRDVVGLLQLFAIPDHLVGQSARGDSLVSAPAARRMALGGASPRDRSFRAAVPAPPVARPETKRTNARGGGRCRHRDEAGGYLLDDRANRAARGIRPALARSRQRRSGSAGCGWRSTSVNSGAGHCCRCTTRTSTRP